MTNNHVVEQVDEIKVLLADKRSFKAKLIGTDPKTDVAVIKVEATGLPTFPGATPVSSRSASWCWLWAIPLV